MSKIVLIDISDDSQEVALYKEFNSEDTALTYMKEYFSEFYSDSGGCESCEAQLVNIEQAKTIEELGEVLDHTYWGEDDRKLSHVLSVDFDGKFKQIW